jgi:nucleoside-diphosphate-sugar epimerase
MNALIGHSGFVGSILKNQTSFDDIFRSTNIGEIDSREFDLVVCAAAPAQKWIANREPLNDRKAIDSLIAHLERVSTKFFVLISTIDVFKNPNGVYENSPIDEGGLHAYGLHRRILEKFVENQFPNSLIVRLPGLVGPGLRKNVIFDFLNDNNLEAINSQGIFQFYPMVNLWYDIQTARHAGLRIVHLTAEPISVAEVAEHGFGKPFSHSIAGVPPIYDMRTLHAPVFGVEGDYQYGRRETFQAIRAYAQTEPRAKQKNQFVNL